MTTPATETTTELDQATKDELQPPCDMKKPDSDMQEPCDQPAAWIVWITDVLTGRAGPKTLICDDHNRWLIEHFKTCWFHRTTSQLHAEPLQ